LKNVGIFRSFSFVSGEWFEAKVRKFHVKLLHKILKIEGKWEAPIPTILMEQCPAIKLVILLPFS